MYAIEFFDSNAAAGVNIEALARGQILNVKHGAIIRIFPALIINEKELDAGMDILAEAIAVVTNK